MYKQYKDVVVTMVEDHLRKNSGFLDIVKGKGRGLIVLLHDGPGSDRTLTAGKPPKSLRKCVTERH